VILRDYQQRAVDAVVYKLQAGWDTLLVSPTGSGKTRMLAATARQLNGDVFALAHRRELVDQLHAAGLSACTRDSFRDRPWIDYLIIDEAHHVAAGSLYERQIQELRAVNPCIKVLGATATPFRLDGKGLEHFNDYVIAATPRELLDAGVLVPYHGFAYRSVDTSGVRKVAGDFAQGALADAASQPKLLGDIVTRWKATASGLSTLVFAVNVAHAQALAAEFQAQGVQAEYLTGKDSKDRRDGLFNALTTRRLPVLINVAIATEGVDIPSLECLVLARPTLSENLALQMAGRVLRSHPGKVQARIHDHAQVLLTHGSPYAERDWTPRATRKRGAAGGGGAQQICSECLALIGASCRACPVCGVVLRSAPPVAPGEGVEIPISSERTEWERLKGRSVTGIYNGADSARHYVDNYSLDRTVVLDNTFTRIPRGSRVRVTYCGERTSRAGFRYHDFRIERSRAQ